MCIFSLPEVLARVDAYYTASERIFESWVGRRDSKTTQRAYREDVISFVFFIGFVVTPRTLS